MSEESNATTSTALADYTAATQEGWNAHHRAEAALAILKEQLKHRSRALYAKVRRLVRATEFDVIQCDYWPLIDHSKRPMQAQAMATIRLVGGNKHMGRVELHFQFTPEQEEFALARLALAIRQ